MQWLGEGPPSSMYEGRTVQAEATTLNLEDREYERKRGEVS